MSAHRLKSWEAITHKGRITGVIPRASSVGKALPQIVSDIKARIGIKENDDIMPHLIAVDLIDSNGACRHMSSLEFKGLVCQHHISLMNNHTKKSSKLVVV